MTTPRPMRWKVLAILLSAFHVRCCQPQQHSNAGFGTARAAAGAARASKLPWSDFVRIALMEPVASTAAPSDEHQASVASPSASSSSSSSSSSSVQLRRLYPKGEVDGDFPSEGPRCGMPLRAWQQNRAFGEIIVRCDQQFVDDHFVMGDDPLFVPWGQLPDNIVPRRVLNPSRSS